MVKYCACSVKGKVRNNNEDHYHANSQSGIFIISDGIGGLPGGEVASHIVVDVLSEQLKQIFPIHQDLSVSTSLKKITSAIQELNRKLYEKALSTKFNGMGATVVAALFRPPHLLLSHLGDSRAYLFNGGSLTQLTQDHTYGRLLLKSGQLSAEKLKGHAANSQLLQYVGMGKQVIPDSRLLEFRREDRLILCSDGLSNMVSNKELTRICASSFSLQELCDGLITAANEAGGVDNITTIVIEND